MRGLAGYVAVAVVALATLTIAMSGDDASRRAPVTAVKVADGTSVPVTSTANPWRSPVPSPTRDPAGTPSIPTPSSVQTGGKPVQNPELAPGVASVVPELSSTSAESSAKLVVAHTGGEGALLRPEPGSSDLIRGWADGTRLSVVGPDREAKGKFWKNVRDPEGNVGWIAVDFLAPATQ